MTNNTPDKGSRNFWNLNNTSGLANNVLIKEKLKMINWCGSAPADRFKGKRFVHVWLITKNYLDFIL